MSAIWLLLTITFGILLLTRHSVEEKTRSLQSADCRGPGLVVILDTDILALCFILCFSFLCATRSDMSYDTEVYRDWYFKIIDSPFFRYDGEYGFAFEYLVKILSLAFGSHYRLIFFALPLINNLILYRVLRNIRDVGTAGYLLYFFVTGFYYNYVVLRQGLAFTFILWAMASWNNKKKLLVLLILAVLSHNTAILFVIFVVLVHLIRLGYHALLVVWALAFVNYFTQFTNVILGQLVELFEGIIPASMKARYVFYFVDQEPQRVFSFYHIILLLILLFLILRARQEAAFEPVMPAYTQIDERRMLNLGVIGAVLLSVGVSFVVVARLADYFLLPCIIFLLPGALKKLYIPYYKPGVLAVCTMSLVLYLRMFLLEAPLYLF